MASLGLLARKYRQSGMRGVAGAVIRQAARLVDPPPPSPPALSHQLTAHAALSRYTTFEGKEILEVGGAQSCESMQPFLDAGAAAAVVTGLGHISEEQTNPDRNLRVMKADAHRLSEVFGSSRFDVVYGLSIIEHIHRPAVFLDEVHAVLRPGGLAYFEGFPIWSSAKGHHVWVAKWGGEYQGKTSANYLFGPFAGHESTNPLPDWSHLLMSPDEMRTFLAEQGIPANDIECIVDWVYVTDDINRLTMADVAAAYGRSKLTVLEMTTMRTDVPPEVQRALRQRHGEGIDYGVSSMAYVLTK